MAGSEYYNHTTFPQTGSAGSSAAMRAELESIESGFGKLPNLAGNANKVAKVNATADGMTVSTITDDGTNVSISGDLTVSGGNVTVTNIGPDADSQHTLPNVAADTITLNAAAQTLTNKTVNLSSNTLTGTLAQFNAAVSDADLVSLAGSETLTNKTLTSPVLSNPSYSGTTANGGTVTTIDINGGTIDGTTIGGTTPAAGTFTTLSATGNVTLGDTSADAHTLNGTMTVATAGEILLDDSITSAGAALPLAFDGDADTGLFRPAANTLAIATGATERLRIRSDGNIGFGGIGGASAVLWMQKNITGGTTSYNRLSNGTIQPDVTVASYGELSSFSTSANGGTPWTLTSLFHYGAGQGTFNADSTVTNQYAFFSNALTGATNNFGFYSNIAAATGAWNFYANGTADNYFNGSVGIGAVPLSTTKTYVSATLSSTSSSEQGIYSLVNATNTSGTITKSALYGQVSAGAGYAGTGSITGVSGLVNTNQPVTVPNARAFSSFISNASTGTFSNATNYLAQDAVNSGGGTITNLYGFQVADLTTGTNDFGVYSNVASGTGRWNFYANGTAENYFAGDTFIGVTTTANSARLRVYKSYSASGNEYALSSIALSSGAALTGYKVGINGIGQTTTGYATSGAIAGILGLANHTVNAETLNNAESFRAAVNNTGTGTITNATTYRAAAAVNSGGGSVTNNYGLLVDAQTVGTNNFGVYSNIAAGTGLWNFYANGTADNYMAGSLGLGAVPVASTKLVISGTLPSTSNVSRAFSNVGTAPSTSTSEIASYYSNVSTQDAAFTASNIYHFAALQGTITGGSRLTPTNQFGYWVSSGLTGATNNIGVQSGIAAATGAWNFYANGTASNYFSGSLGIGTTAVTDGKVTIRSDSSGALSSVLVLQNVVSSVQDTAVGLYFQPNSSFSRAASIQSFQSTAGNYADLRFFTANATTPAEAMRITNGRNVVIGGLAARTNLNTTSLAPVFQIEGTASDARTASITSQGGTTATAGPNFILARTRGTVLGDNTVVASGDTLGEIRFHGADGTNVIQAAGIEARVDATPGSNDMPGNLLFKTTADGASSSTERWRIDSNGFMNASSGSFGRGAPVTKTADFTVAAAENWLINNKAGSTCTVTLPAASSFTGREITIKTIQAQTVVSASSNVIPLAGGAAGTAILAAVAGRWATLVSNGTNWEIMASN